MNRVAMGRRKIAISLATAAALLLGASNPIAAKAAEFEAPLKFYFSNTVLAGLNKHDAKAATITWARLLAKREGIRMDPDLITLDDPNSFAKTIAASTNSMFSLTGKEVASLPKTPSTTSPWRR